MPRNDMTGVYCCMKPYRFFVITSEDKGSRFFIATIYIFMSPGFIQPSFRISSLVPSATAAGTII